MESPLQPSPIVTTKIPQSKLSGSDIAQPFQSIASGMESVSAGLEKVAVPLAENDAAAALNKQKVTLNADGSANIENPASAPLLFGEAGEAYHRAVLAGTIAQYDTQLSQSFNEMHQKHLGDPTGFKAASDKFLQTFATGAPPMLQQAVARQGAQLQTQHFNALTDQAASLDVDNNRKSIAAQIDDQKNTLIALARQGGTDTPEFKQAVTKMNAAYDALGSNPLFKMPQEQIDLEKKNTAALLQGEALVAQVDATFKKRDGKALAQDELSRDILQNPNLREVDRTRLYAQGMARLAYLSGDAKATVDANRQITTEMEKTLANGTLKAEDPAVGMAIQRATSIGDTESAQRITAAAAMQQHLRGLNVLPDSVRNEALGVHLGPVERVQGAILGQESGNRDNAATSVTGAMGPGQIQPATFAQYARPGERIDNPADNRAVSNRIVSDYYNRYGGDAQRVAVAYFSGPGNVAPAGSPTPWINDRKDPTGKSTSSYVSDVSRRLGGPSVNGGPGFSAADAQRNPFLISAYVRSLAADPELRVQSAKQTADAVGKSLDNGFLPAASSVAEVNQAAALYPDKLGKVADEMNGRLAGQRIAQLPADQRQQIEDQYRAATAGPDVHQTNLAAAALSQVDRQDQNMREHPLVEAANRGWVQPPAPINPQQPDTIAAALVDRASKATRIGVLNQQPAPPILDKDDTPKLQSALQGQAGAQVLGQIQQALKPDEMKMLLDQEAFRSAVTGMSRSGDPAKMNAAYSFMDGQQRTNPLQFDRQFPEGLKDLRAWQSNLSFYPPDEAAKRLMRQYDPAQSNALKASNEVATKALESVSADKVVSKFSTGFGPFGTGARAPVGPMAGVAAGALKADYDQNYRDGYAATGDPTSADKFAMEKLNLKYAVSPTNGNRVMANAPERYYPQVGGSHDWMADQLDHDINQATGGKLFEGERTSPKQGPRYAVPSTDLGAIASREYNARRAIVADRVTETDIANGRPPSYQVILQDSNGRWNALPDASGAARRIRFDPAEAFAKRASTAEAQREAQSVDNAGAVQPLMSPVTPGSYDRMAAGGGNAAYSGGVYDDFRRSEDIEDRRNRRYSQDPFVDDPNYKPGSYVSGADLSDMEKSQLSRMLGADDLRGLNEKQRAEKQEAVEELSRRIREMRKSGSDLPLPRRGRPYIQGSE